MLLLNRSGLSTSNRGLARMLLAVLATSFFLLVTHLYWQPSFTEQISSFTTTKADAEPEPEPETSVLERQRALWSTLHPLLETYAPGCPSPQRGEEKSGSIHFTPNPEDAALRPDLTKMPEEDVKLMRKNHVGYVNSIRATHETGAFTKIRKPGSRGVVSTAGGIYIPVFLSSLRMLRRSGSDLPVELFLKDAREYEPKVCEEILPSLNAKCMVLDEIINEPGSEDKVEIAHYQLKIFAMLFSSFEEIVWIDADCFSLHKPDILFDSAPFTETGMVVWPDYWTSTASPLYYNIANVAIPPMTAAASSETGQFMISKKTHYLTLLLSAYYNYYGPSHYFMLLSQGAPGEGDKETFITAATAVNEPYYQVSFHVQPIGHPKDGGISGSAMVQSNPMEDYAITTSGDTSRVPSVFFIHAHYPKFNPATVFGYSWETTPTLKPDGSEGRAWWYPEDTVKRFGYDAERNYWEEIKWVACNLESDLQAWQGKGNICEHVKSYWAHVFEEPHDDDPVW